MKDLPTLLQEEKELTFPQFNNTIAWELGRSAVEKATEESLPLAIGIHRNGQLLFTAFLEGTTRDNSRWIEGKQKICAYFQHSSLYVSRHMKSRGKNVESYFLDPTEYRPWGGAFPILLSSGGIIGSLTVSGLTDEEDHDFAVDVIRDYLNTSQKETIQI